ncbi:MAG: 7-cyano-7-deazaguanine synthase QueC [Candidatus Paceibacterota bacterium]|jgi:7-cyano-7-deazaguanine synthase
MKVVVLLSGGMDSATLLYKMIKEHSAANVSTLSVSYGQRHRRELEFAWRLASDLVIPHQIVPLDGLQHVLRSALTSGDIAVPEGHYAAESMKATVVPMRNAIFLSVAVGHAWSIGAERVATAIHAGDHAIYPDCRPEFLDAFNVMVKTASDGFVQPQVTAPFVHISKTEIAKLGQTLGVPWALTWSCYKGGEKHCGVCGTCVERRESLATVGDPTEYTA